MQTRFFIGVSIVGIIYCLINVGYVATHLTGTPDGNILTFTLLQSVTHLLSLLAYSLKLWLEKVTVLEQNADLRASQREQSARQELARQHLIEMEPLLSTNSQLREEVNELITLLSDETPVARGTIPVAMRRSIIERDYYTCTYCGQQGTAEAGPDALTWHIDHVIPVSRGGPTLPTNLTLSCAGCNLSKGDRTPIEYMRRGVSAP